MLKLGVIFLMASLMVLGLQSTCVAAEEGSGSQATPATKLGNGLNNLLTGWVEIPRQISEVSNEQDMLAGITVGTIKGSVYAVGRTAAGALDTVTFMFPSYDKPIMEPLYQF